jgi:hypothetical protein
VVRLHCALARFGLVCLTLFQLSLAGHGQSPNTADADAKPITVYADEVQGWSDETHNSLLARGNVSIERGLTRVRMKEVVLWITKASGSDNESFTAILYGEGDVSYEESGKPKQNFDRISLHWKTIGEVRVKAPVKKSGQPAVNDPLFQRALTALQQPPPLNAPPKEEVLPAPAPIPETGERKPAPTIQTVRQRDFNRNPISPSPDVANVVQRSSALGITSRGTTPFQYKWIVTGEKENAVLVWGGITLYSGDENSIIDISTDRAVIWIKGMGAGNQGLPNFSNLHREQVELYLEGHVEIRYAHLIGPAADVQQLVLADRGYYDMGRNVALLGDCEVIYRLPGLAIPIHLQAKEVRQLDLNNFQANEATFFASRLPSDPDLKIMTGDLSLQLREIPHKGVFGTTAFDPLTHGSLKDIQLYGSANDVQFRFLDTPVGYLNHAEGDLRHPFGPLEDVRVKTDKVFGTGLRVGLDAFQLFGIEQPDDTHWHIDPLFYSRRGPGLISEFQTSGVGAFGFPGRYDTFVRAQIQDDNANTDILSRNREPLVPQELRGLFSLQHRQELNENWTFQTQVGYFSDRNFYEQWWKQHFDEDINQETYVQLKYQNENLALTGMVKPNIRDWVNESADYPRLDGWLIGQDFFNTLSYFGHASAGFYRFNTSSDLAPPYFATPFPDQFNRYRPLPPSSDMPNKPTFNTVRLDFMNEVDLPLHLGIMNLTPYALGDGAFYSEGMDGDSHDRLYYGGGMRAAIPFSRLYSDVQSDFFNVHGIYHKISFEADYRWTQSTVDFRRLPLIDRLDDDATDQARRDLRVYRIMNNINPNLATSDLYDPQLYALRRGYLDSPDNLDDMEYLRFGMRNRWQTKRGIAEAERTVDWITFDVFASYFPNETRDNYGHPFGLIDYDFRWQIGERTSLLSNGVFDPFQGGARGVNVGLLVERTERLRFFFGYYRLDPVGTNALVFSTSYIVNPRYSLSWTSSYDFGSGKNLGESFVITRTGSDIQVGLGFGWDPLRNNFTATFELYPTVLGPTQHMKRIAPGLAQLDPSISPY